MPKTITKTVYTFDELSDPAKEKARDWYREGMFDYAWWESTYEDAERIGLAITSFDLDRNKCAKGKLLLSPPEVIAAIVKEHGVACKTYKTALRFADIYKQVAKDNAGDDDKFLEENEAVNEEFLKALCEDYADMLQKETEFMESDEQIDENIKANEYTFTETGKREG